MKSDPEYIEIIPNGFPPNYTMRAETIRNCGSDIDMGDSVGGCIE